MLMSTFFAKQSKAMLIMEGEGQNLSMLSKCNDVIMKLKFGIFN